MNDVISVERNQYSTLGDFDDIDDDLEASSGNIKSLSRSRSAVSTIHNNDGVSNDAALFHVICVIAGSGILQLPFALSQSGWLGVPLMVMVGVVTEYTGRLLIECLYV